MEKYIYGGLLKKLPSFVRHIYALFFIIIGWAIFIFTDSDELFNYIGFMFSGQFIGHDALRITISYAPLLVIAAAASLPIRKNLYAKIRDTKITGMLELIFVAAILILCTASLVSDSYNPFLYFRF